MNNKTCLMFSNPHNLASAAKSAEKRYGIRISLTENDPFRRLLAEDWTTFHWFADAAQRDSALTDMSRRHEFSRIGDAPTLRYEPVER